MVIVILVFQMKVGRTGPSNQFEIVILPFPGVDADFLFLDQFPGFIIDDIGEFANLSLGEVGIGAFDVEENVFPLAFKLI